MLKVLITDDSPEFRDRLISLLSDVKGIGIVGEAEDVPGASEMIQKFQPDVVILDIRLVNGSGIDVLREIKKEDSPPIVIVLTNYPYPQYREKCEAFGAEYFYDKSTEFNRIPGLMEKLVNRHHNS